MSETEKFRPPPCPRCGGRGHYISTDRLAFLCKGCSERWEIEEQEHVTER